MLQDSGLDVHDRNMIQIAVGKAFNTAESLARAADAMAGSRAEAQGPKLKAIATRATGERHWSQVVTRQRTRPMIAATGWSMG